MIGKYHAVHIPPCGIELAELLLDFSCGWARKGTAAAGFLKPIGVVKGD
jgi:hypothetical protein